jgi:hypothetical protein
MKMTWLRTYVFPYLLENTPSQSANSSSVISNFCATIFK